MQPLLAVPLPSCIYKLQNHDHKYKCGIRLTGWHTRPCSLTCAQLASKEHHNWGGESLACRKVTQHIQIPKVQAGTCLLGLESLCFQQEEIA